MEGYMGYFTAGVEVALGLVIMIGFGRKLKLCYVAGPVLMMIGVWRGLQTALPENEIINGWLSWVVKGIAAAILIILMIVLLTVRRREEKEFKEKEARGEHVETYDLPIEVQEQLREEALKKQKRAQKLYDSYDDFDYDHQEKYEKQSDSDE